MLGLLVLAACAPQPVPPGEGAAPGGTREPPPVEAAGMQALRQSDIPLGVYFLHEAGLGTEGCVLMGARRTGTVKVLGRAEMEQARSRAVLDLAEQARWMGGNVVVLPDFHADFQAGQLNGQVYRCGDAQRREIYHRAAAGQLLTVVPQ